MKNKGWFTCVTIVSATIIIIVAFLMLRKVGERENCYSFTRVYVDNLPAFKAMADSSAKVPSLQRMFPSAIDAMILVDGRYLVLDMSYSDSTGSFAFFIKNKQRSGQHITDSLMIVSLHQDSYHLKQERFLAYEGHFTNASGFITYTFYHCPWIYVFMQDGTFITVIQTKDNVPLPTIIRYKEYFFYKRGATFNSNQASFCDGLYVYVISYRVPSAIDNFLVDIYDLSSGRYVGSQIVEGVHGFRNDEITYSWSANGRVYLKVKDKKWKLESLAHIREQ